MNSKAVREDVIHRDHVRPSKLVLIYNGVDRAPFESALDQRLQTRRGLGIGEQDKAVIVVGNLIPYKGHADLIEAAGKVIHHVPDVRFIIVGEDRGIRHDLEKKTDRMGMTEYIKFLGRRDDVPHLLAASDLSVLPSHEEGFSNVILESMAAGLPVVATSAGGNGEGVEDGVTGWLVPPKDPDALAEKIMDLLRDPDRARAWGKRGRKRVGDYFSVDRMVQSHLELYRSARASKIRVQMARLWS